MCNIFRVVERLKFIELNHGIKDRWEVDGERYLNYQNRHLRDLQEEKKNRIWSAIIRRQWIVFLRYYNDKISIINSTIVTIESHPSTAFNKGSIALLNM